MALTATLRWMNRVNGLETNGGGFDPSPGTGTDYSDQDAPQLSIADLTSTNSTTVTSVLSTFTSAMVNNILRLASGTGTTPGYYLIKTFVSASQVTLDRVSGTYTVGVAKVGGAHADLRNMSNGGNILPSPAIASPLAPGHVVYIRSAGSSADPSIAGTPDYDYSAGYYQFPAGNYTVGRIMYIGLGASEAIPAAGVLPAYRPLLKTCGLMFYITDASTVVNVKWFPSSSPTYTTYGLLNGVQTSTLFCICDMNGTASNASGIRAAEDMTGSTFANNWVKNTGGGSTGQTQPAIHVPYNPAAQTYGTSILNNLVTDVRGPGIVDAQGLAVIDGNIVANPGGDGINIGIPSTLTSYVDSVVNNTVYNPVGHGIAIAADTLSKITCFNNTISKIASGKNAINVGSGSAAVSDALKKYIDYNNVFLDGGAGGLYGNISAGAHDTNLDPQFTNAGAYDFSVGTNLKGKGYPGGFTGGTSTGYMDSGAVQRQEAGGTTVVQVSNVAVFGRESVVGY